MPSACARFAPPSTSKTKRKKISSSCGPHVCSCHFICPCPTAFSRAFPCKAFELLQAWLDCSRFRMHWFVSRHLRLKFACSNRLTSHTLPENRAAGQRTHKKFSSAGYKNNTRGASSLFRYSLTGSAKSLHSVAPQYVLFPTLPSVRSTYQGHGTGGVHTVGERLC